MTEDDKTFVVNPDRYILILNSKSQIQLLTTKLEEEITNHPEPDSDANFSLLKPKV